MAASKKQSGARVWLLKTEPDSFSFQDLLAAPRKRTTWDGVRNYQARNFLRDDVAVGDLALIYHSSADPTGVVGLARVVKAAAPDPTQFDPTDDHFDAASKRDAPTWVQIEIEGVVLLPVLVTLAMLKSDPRLARMLVVQRGQRLSVQPVEVGEARVVLEQAGLDPTKFLS